MSASTENQNQLLAEKLHARRNELLEDIMVQVREKEGDKAAELDAHLDQNDDFAFANELIELNPQYVAGELEKLRGVQDAEVRMQEGTYGLCIDCHQDISPDKLQLQPSASRCSQCEQLHQHAAGSGEHSYH